MIPIAWMTVREMVRRRFAIAALLGTLVLVALTGWGLQHIHTIHKPHGVALSPLEIRTVTAALVPLIAYLFSFILAFAAIVLGATMLSAEIESGVLLPVLARPISRGTVVVGKALGLGALLCAYAAISGGLEFAVIDAVTGYQPPHPVAAIASLAALAIVMLCLTLAVASRLQTVATSVVAVVGFGVSWIVGIVASFGPVYHNELLLRIGVISQLLLPSDALWRVAVYQLQPVVLVAQFGLSGWPGPFFVLSPPPPAMLAWSVVWVVAVTAIAVRSFAARDV